MQEKWIDTPRGRVYYWRTEETKKQAIFFAHGQTADHTLFRKQMDIFSKEYTVIAWDMGLHGKSRPYKDFTFEHAAEDMREIFQQENIQEAVLVGQSAGGYACQVFVRRFPRMARAFIGVGTTPLDASYYTKSDLFWVLHFPDVASWYPYPMFCMASARTAAMTSDARQSFYDTLLELGQEDMLKATRGVSDALYEALGNVTFPCPVLLIMGEKDKVGEVAKYNVEWNLRTGYPLIIIPGAGHNVNDDADAQFNLVTLDFLRQRLAQRL